MLGGSNVKRLMREGSTVYVPIYEKESIIVAHFTSIFIDSFQHVIIFDDPEGTRDIHHLPYYYAAAIYVCPRTLPCYLLSYSM